MIITRNMKRSRDSITEQTEPHQSNHYIQRNNLERSNKRRKLGSEELMDYETYIRSGKVDKLCGRKKMIAKRLQNKRLGRNYSYHPYSTHRSSRSRVKNKTEHNIPLIDMKMQSDMTGGISETDIKRGKKTVSRRGKEAKISCHKMRYRKYHDRRCKNNTRMYHYHPYNLRDSKKKPQRRVSGLQEINDTIMNDDDSTISI